MKKRYTVLRDERVIRLDRGVPVIQRSQALIPTNRIKRAVGEIVLERGLYNPTIPDWMLMRAASAAGLSLRATERAAFVYSGAPDAVAHNCAVVSDAYSNLEFRQALKRLGRCTTVQVLGGQTR